jgi:hypothetical protein
MEMIGAVIELASELVAGVTWWIFVTIVIFPILYILGMRVVLVVALFGRGTYGERVRSGYRGIQTLCMSFSPYY